MQQFIKQRHTLEGEITFETPAVDLGDVAFFIGNLIVYTITGAAASLSIQAQTSDDLDTWTNVGSPFAGSTAGSTRAAVDAKSDLFGRYVRFELAFTGTTPTVSYSLVINTHHSS